MRIFKNCISRHLWNNKIPLRFQTFFCHKLLILSDAAMSYANLGSSSLIFAFRSWTTATMMTHRQISILDEWEKNVKWFNKTGGKHVFNSVWCHLIAEREDVNTTCGRVLKLDKIATFFKTFQTRTKIPEFCVVFSVLSPKKRRRRRK